jgi:hypothetical protein
MELFGSQFASGDHNLKRDEKSDRGGGSQFLERRPA